MGRLLDMCDHLVCAPDPLDLNSLNVSKAFKLLRSIYFLYVFWYITRSTIYILFHEVICQTIQLIQNKTCYDITVHAQ